MSSSTKIKGMITATFKLAVGKRTLRHCYSAGLNHCDSRCFAFNNNWDKRKKTHNITCACFPADGQRIITVKESDDKSDRSLAKTYITSAGYLWSGDQPVLCHMIAGKDRRCCSDNCMAWKETVSQGEVYITCAVCDKMFAWRVKKSKDKRIRRR